jgi:hypothetical protein
LRCACPAGWGSFNALQLAWALNSLNLGEADYAPTVTFTGPPTGNTVRTASPVITFTISASSLGLAGYTVSWDTDPGDPYSEASQAHGQGTPFYGPHVLGQSTGTAPTESTGCHTLHVRDWDNGGNSADWTYGPVCYDSCSSPYNSSDCGGVCCSGMETCGTGNICCAGTVVDGTCCPSSNYCDGACTYCPVGSQCGTLGDACGHVHTCGTACPYGDVCTNNRCMVSHICQYPDHYDPTTEKCVP